MFGLCLTETAERETTDKGGQPYCGRGFVVSAYRDLADITILGSTVFGLLTHIIIIAIFQNKGPSPLKEM